MSDVNDDSFENEEDPLNPYLLIHILPRKTGEKAEREIVPASTIKKFQYEEYKKNKNTYKEKKFNYKRGPDGVKYQCYILYAGSNYNKVYDKSISTRFSIPTLSTTLNGDETINSEVQEQQGEIEDANIAEGVAKAKRKVKNKKQQQKKQKDIRENLILEKHLNKQQYDEDRENDSDELNLPTLITSTPLRNATNLPKENDIINELKRQATNYKNLYINQRRENEKLMKRIKTQHPNEIEDENNHQQESFNNSANNEIFYPEVNPFQHYDEVYSYQPNEKLVYDEFGNIILTHGVLCNPKAYNDSWKTKSPSKCLAILSQGVYQLEDLAERCVRKQKNTRHKKKLDPMKTVALEKQVYKFMRTKNFVIEDVECFLRRLNTVHHQCITKAIKRCETLKSLNEEDQNEDEDIDYRGPLNN